MIKKEILIVLMIISIFMISACDIYNTLYVKQAGEEVGEVPGEDIISDTDIDVEEVEIDIEDIFEEEIEDVTGAIVEEIEVKGEVEEEAVEVPEEDIIVEEEIIVEVEEEEKRISEDATVLIVEETDPISLVPTAEDPDKDTLVFTFTSPIDDNGEWQTTYGDAGEYTITVTASDGELTANKEVLIIVNRKEEAPVLSSFMPKDEAIQIDETGSLAFEVDASDLNDDVLTYSWKLDGVTIGDGNSIEYQSTYEDSGSHTVKVIVSDGIFDADNIWSVTVNNVNREPVLNDVGDIEARETDTIVIELEAWDDDGDEMSFAIDDGKFVQDENMFTWETTYDDAGEHLVTVSVSDGTDTVSQEVAITIENVNRAPIILDIIQK
jgi:PKD repeat protein|tara:strand:+ start:92 stop:1231 length:1140 start_codon:yes stop_codon:yes gene_type:complete